MDFRHPEFDPSRCCVCQWERAEFWCNARNEPRELGMCRACYERAVRFTAITDYNRRGAADDWQPLWHS